MTMLHALVLGIVEGLTEFLPISSTGHLILAGQLLRLEETAFLKSFDIAIQLGAVLAVVLLYGKRLAVDRSLLGRVALAFLPSGIVGLLIYTIVKNFLLGNSSVVVWALLLGGVAMIIFEHTETNKQSTVISYRQAFIIGFIQTLAMIPGVSRSGATIIGGLALGIERKATVEFSFLLAIPTMLAATGYDLWKNAGAFSLDQFTLLGIGFVCSFAVALASIRFLLRFIQTHTFLPFGLYRIAAAILFWMMQ